MWTENSQLVLKEDTVHTVVNLIATPSLCLLGKPEMNDPFTLDSFAFVFRQENSAWYSSIH